MKEVRRAANQIRVGCLNSPKASAYVPFFRILFFPPPASLPAPASLSLPQYSKDKERNMGRGKIEIKRIENSTNRQVTYSKRRGGIMKKAKEITVLCDAQVSLVIFSSSGKMSEYCSPSTSLVKMLERYHKSSGKKLWDAKHEHLSNEIERIKKENDSMQIKLRHLKGQDLTSLNPRELIPIEDALENGLANVREKQMAFFRMMKKNGRALEEENKRLNYIMDQQHLAMAGNVRELEHGYHERERECPPHIPFAFRVQPIQPNLHQNK